jgi:hypothetical protein
LGIVVVGGGGDVEESAQGEEVPEPERLGCAGKGDAAGGSGDLVLLLGGAAAEEDDGGGSRNDVSKTISMWLALGSSNSSYSSYRPFEAFVAVFLASAVLDTPRLSL